LRPFELTCFVFVRFVLFCFELLERKTMVAKGKGKGRHGDTFLGEKLAFYQSYHNNPWNKIIHVICIPLIVWAVLVWFCLVEVKVPVLDKEINLGMATTIAYSVMYTLADYSAGLTWVVFIGAPLYTVAMEAATAMEAKTASLWALAAFVFGFWVQIHAGHMVFEKRKPALMDGFAEVRFELLDLDLGCRRRRRRVPFVF